MFHMGCGRTFFGESTSFYWAWEGREREDGFERPPQIQDVEYAIKRHHGHIRDEQ